MENERSQPNSPLAFQCSRKWDNLLVFNRSHAIDSPPNTISGLLTFRKLRHRIRCWLRGYHLPVYGYTTCWLDNEGHLWSNTYCHCGKHRVSNECEYYWSWDE